MILGIGSDMIDIRRIEQAMERFGDRFLERIFTDVERRKCDRRANRSASLVNPEMSRNTSVPSTSRQRLAGSPASHEAWRSER